MLEHQLQIAQDAVQKKDLEVQVCKVEFDARSAEERLRFASEIKARNEELLALRVERDDCVRQWAAEKSAMQEEMKVFGIHCDFFPSQSVCDSVYRPWQQSCARAAAALLN
jgi:hypothetical protein